MKERTNVKYVNGMSDLADTLLADFACVCRARERKYSDPAPITTYGLLDRFMDYPSTSRITCREKIEVFKPETYYTVWLPPRRNTTPFQVKVSPTHKTR